MAPESQVAACAICGEPANNKCSACKSDTLSRQYCSKICQKKDWPTHKRACKDAQNTNLEGKLARVAEIVQQAYYDFRENTWDLHLVKIDDGDDALVVYDGEVPERSHPFTTFPQHLFSNEQTKHAVICMLMCNEPLAWMHNIIYKLLTDLPTKVQEVSLQLGSIPRKTITCYPEGELPKVNWPGYTHEAIRITSTTTKQQWIMDISGAQYGINKCLWTWQAYEHSHQADIQSIRPLGFNKAALTTLGKIQGSPTITYGVIGQVAEFLAMKVNEWSTQTGMTLPQLIMLGQKEYESNVSGLLKFMHNTVRTFIKANRFEEEWAAMVLYEDSYPGVSKSRYDRMMRDIFSAGTFVDKE